MEGFRGGSKKEIQSGNEGGRQAVKGRVLGTTQRDHPAWITLAAVLS